MNAPAQGPAALATEILGDLHIQFAAGTTYTRDEIEAQFSAISENAVVQALDILIEAGLVRSTRGSGALVPIERRQHQAPLHDAHVRESHAHEAPRPAADQTIKRTVPFTHRRPR